ncbi:MULTISPECIES: GNAT family N-acetyltransferase [Pseudoalteromonas]|uniref:GNAT family N-acetyltransferase n=1 Tax=Pseudoalteromonas amylolytica TaxID=1859457 RepID=A0A1S1MY44_9GAMM|nr:MULTISPECIES: GNAT family N-acetyltransferase [Pseudoalteromonas]OHU87652.1 GNAT family N-acetyltransferase [Pseudoalteromonas sp. JW3]OHU91094.1 GNAT family N-acetyltransferase [Pseudoalteromonas amylolytica]
MQVNVASDSHLILSYFDDIHANISQSYWAENIPKPLLRKALENSVCFAIIDPQAGLMAFARMITDKATFGYLADVFVQPAFQGQGLSKRLMEAIQTHPELQGLRRTMLATKDAHGLYEQYGFEPITDASPFMQIVVPDIYKPNL